MKIPLSSLDAIRDAIRPICERQSVSQLEVFGSVARGDFKPESDIDLLVEFLPDFRPGLFEMGALKEDLEERLGCRVDLLTRKAVVKSRNTIRRDAILGNRVTLYARS